MTFVVVKQGPRLRAFSLHIKRLTLSACDAKISGMKKQIIALMMAIGVMTPMVSHAYIAHDTAIVRIMNKAAGKAQTIKIPVGREVSYEKLDMLVRTCQQTDPFQAEDFFMFIEISQKSKIFSGWMSRNEPGNNPLQHPDYDVWLVGCE